MSKNDGINMLTTVQCPSCKQRGEWSRTEDKDNRCVVMRCRKCNRAIGEELYDHLDKIESANSTVGFTEEEKKCNDLIVQALSTYRAMRPVNTNGVSTFHHACDDMRTVLAKRVVSRDLPWEAGQ